MSFLRKNQSGFSLLEMMLVGVILSMFIYMGIGYMQTRTRALMLDRASAQMQQILNAGLAYYVNNGTWPSSIAVLQSGSYLPPTVVSPWATSYSISTTGGVFNVTVTLPSALANRDSIGRILAGKLPLATSTTGAPTTMITASVNIPGQNLNNATAVNFAGLYHNGACVPAPTCPVDPSGANLTPQIMVVPVSVSGMAAGDTKVYPLSSFTAFATALTDLASGGPPDCGTNSTASAACYSDVYGGTQITSGKYWRVCLQVVTENGPVTWNNTTGQYASVMAITRCGISSENTGSSFNVWAN